MEDSRQLRVDLSKTALLVVDMIHDYLAEDGEIICEAGRDIVRPINQVSEFVRAGGGSVAFCNTELTNTNEPIARRWGLHAQKGTQASAVYEGVKIEPDHDLVVPKTAYNAFFRTNLDEILSNNGIENTIVCGIHTHVCVLLTASNASDLGYKVFALEDCMTTGHRPNHDTRLRFFSTHLGTLSISSEFITANQ